jgi:DNA-directed RNA polymerase subunit M
MEFCPNCSSFLVPTKTKEGEKVIVVLACSKCGYRKKASAKKAQAQVGTGKVLHPKSKPIVTIISEEDQKMATLPTLKVECPKCGNTLVYVWQVQTRGGDEASTQFMRCTKCNHTFREYT